MNRLLRLAAVLVPLACVAEASVPLELRLTAIETGQPEPILSDRLSLEEAGAAPLALRGCFHTPLSLALLTETFAVYDAARPQPAARGLPCFDAARIGADLAAGTAVAFLSEADIAPGIDRVVAVYADGRAFVWHQNRNPAGSN